MSDREIIEMAGVSCSIGAKAVLRDISFSVREGEYLSILGPNGAGKTTLLKCLDRIASAWEGAIRLFGKPLHDYSRKELARLISYVPQSRDPLFPFTVREFLFMSRYPYLSPFAPPAKADHDAVDKALQLTSMTSFSERRVSTLSGGECQKVFIAAAVAQETPILLLDEPITFLDPRYQCEIIRLLKQLNRDASTTVIAVSHDINSAVLSSDRILALKEGRIVFWGDVQEVMDPRTLEGIFDTTFTFAEHPVAGIPVVVPEH